MRNYENEYWEAQSHINELEGDNKILRKAYVGALGVALLLISTLERVSLALIEGTDEVKDKVSSLPRLNDDG